MYKTSTLVLTLIIASVSVSAIQAKDNWDKWRIMENDHFRIYSDEKEKKVRALLEDIEKFRLVVEKALNVEVPKINVLLFNSSRDYKKIAPTGKIAGFVQSIDGVATIVIPSIGRGLKSEAIIKHEYARIAQAYDSRKTPSWFREGMAEMFANVNYYGEYAVIGSVQRSHTRYAYRRLNYNHIISNDFDTLENQLGADPYAQYWLLTNYIMTHDDGVYRDKLSKYLRQFQSGVESKIAFKSAFGVDANSFARQATNLYRKPIYRNQPLIYKMDLTIMESESTLKTPMPNRVANIMNALSKSLEDW